MYNPGLWKLNFVVELKKKTNKNFILDEEKKADAIKEKRQTAWRCQKPVLMMS